MFNFDRAFDGIILDHSYLGGIYKVEADTQTTGSGDNGLSHYLWRLVNNGMKDDEDNLRIYIKNTNNKQLTIEYFQMSPSSFSRDVLLADLMNK